MSSLSGKIFGVCVCVFVCVCMCMCVHVCVCVYACACTLIYVYTRTPVHTYPPTHTHLAVCASFADDRAVRAGRGISKEHLAAMLSIAVKSTTEGECSDGVCV